MGRTWAKSVVVAAVLAVASAACSGGTPKAAGSVVASTTTPSSSPAPTEQSRAQAVVLRSADFPSGWKGTAHMQDPADKEFERRVRACSGVSPAASTTDLFGDDFDLNQASVGSEAQFYNSVAVARADIDSVSNTRLFACVRNVLVDELKAALAKQGAQGATLSHVSLVRTAIAKYADQSAAVRLTATVTVGNQAVRFFQDIFVARKGRFEATASFFNIGSAFPAALERSLFGTLAARLVADGGA